MAFDFNGGKSKGGKTFDPTQGVDMVETSEDNQFSGGFQGFSFGNPKTQGTSSRDLIDSYGGGDINVPNYGSMRHRSGINFNASNARLLIIVALVLACVILVIVFWDKILRILYSIGAVLIIAVVLLIIVRIIFPSRRR